MADETDKDAEKSEHVALSDGQRLHANRFHPRRHSESLCECYFDGWHAARVPLAEENAKLRAEKEQVRMVNANLKEQLRELESQLASRPSDETLEERDELMRLGEWLSVMVWRGTGPVMLCTTEDGNIGVFLDDGDNAKAIGTGDEAIDALLNAMRQNPIGEKEYENFIG